MKFAGYNNLDLPKVAEEILHTGRSIIFLIKVFLQEKESRVMFFMKGPPSANGMPGITPCNGTYH